MEEGSKERKSFSLIYLRIKQDVSTAINGGYEVRICQRLKERDSFPKGGDCICRNA